MKKKSLIFFICVILLLAASSVFLAGCGGVGEKVTYSVTVLNPDETPREGINVKWVQSSKTQASAVTDESGKASVELPASTYTVLMDVGAGWEPSELSVGSSMREPIVILSRIQVNYQTTVVDKNGLPASGVTVSWVKDESVAGSATTDAEGVASCELDYDDYTVIVGNLPAGNVFAGTAPTATADNAAVRIELTDGATTNYSVTVKSEGGLLFKNFTVMLYKDGILVSAGTTNDSGVWSAHLADGVYTVRPRVLEDGYSALPVTLTSSYTSTTLLLKSEIIKTAPTADTRYYIGSIFHDYTFTTPYNVGDSPLSLTISELLKTKDAILINNWGKDCSYCMREMPAMRQAYLKYRDKIELIAVNNYQSRPDSAEYIKALYNSAGYEFPMVRDENVFTRKFGITGWPTTVVIDRYGAVARIEEGAIQDEEVWDRLIKKYIGDDYVQSFEPGSNRSDSITTEVAKPDIVLPDDHFEQMADVLNNTDAFPEGASVTYDKDTTSEYSWPYVFGTVAGVSETDPVVYAGGTGKANSVSVLYAYVTVEAGKVFTFDYYSDTEAGSDVMTVLWDGKSVKEISGKSNGWQTCRLYSELLDGEHRVAFVYIKDSSINTGKDNVFIRNVRFTELDEITEPTNMLRSAAYGNTQTGALRFPHYASVELGDDGYYYVNASELENHGLAGNDDKPMLFVNLLTATNWAGVSVRTIVYGTDDNNNFVYNIPYEFRVALVPYLQTATNSDLPGFIPVDEDVKDMIDTLVSYINKLNPHDDEWLELCYYYSHYGSGSPLGNPILGLTEKTAIKVLSGRNTATLTRNMQPFPITIYTFTPATSGVYRFHSLLTDEEEMSQIWLYDDSTTIERPLAYCGEDFSTRDGEDENNFDLYRYLTAGHKYYIALAYQMFGSGTYQYDITRVGNSVSILSPAASQFYYQILNDDGEWDGESLLLANAVSYRVDQEGYYRAVNPDGTTGSYIYLDVQYATGVYGLKSFTDLVNSYVRDPLTFDNLTYKTFDFTTCINYTKAKDDDGNEVINYNPDFDLTVSNIGGEDRYKDYTERLLEIIESAPKSGSEKGLVKVNQEIVDVLTMYFEFRNNAMYEGVYEPALENEWLRFCRYVRLYDENNV